MSSSQSLASKDASLFRTVLKCYETKQYKKGLKTAEQILRKNPNHGETLAMKGLIMNSIGRTDEAFTIAKEALKHDMKSHVCWHVYGLLYRSEKNYDESIKAYKMALRFQPESQQILRDLALLQIQMRDYNGYVESRRQIMQLRPQLRQNWTGLAIAHHLAGNYEDAEKVLVTFEGTLKQANMKGDIEHWEAGLYRNQIKAESGDIEGALEHLESIAKRCLDKLAVMEMRAKYLLQLSRKEEAVAAYRALLERNPENRAYYAGLEEAMDVKPEERQAIYSEYAEKFERADAPRRIPLDFLEGDEFREAADSYLQAKLKKGVPSTFANVKALYSDPAKRQTLFELVESYDAAQEKEKTETNGDTNGTSEPSKFRIWTLYFLAMHYDHYRTRDMEKAMKYVEKAKEIAPNTVEFYLTIARILKHAGDYEGAMKTIDEGRNLDKSDRYINTKTAKYQLRNDRNEDALATMGLFTRNDAAGGPLGDLLEMQCIWFITEDGESYQRQNRLGLALKRFHAINKIFDDWIEDQFDFHSFSLRKGMIRAYVDQLRWEDSLRAHPFYHRAALGAINTYVLLHDRPHLAHEGLANGGLDGKFEELSIADKKKALKKAKRDAQKAQEKADAAAQKAKEDKNKNAQVGEEDVKKEDTDPYGSLLAQTKEPLLEATKWLDVLLAPANHPRLEAWTAGFEVFFRRKKWLRAMQCLESAWKMDPEDPQVHEQSIRLRKIVDDRTEIEELKAPTKEALEKELDAVISKGTDLVKVNEEFLAAHKDSPAHVFGAIRTRRFLDPENKDVKELLSTADAETLTLSQATEGLSLLKSIDEGEAKTYADKLSQRFPHAKAFKL